METNILVNNSNTTRNIVIGVSIFFILVGGGYFLYNKYQSSVLNKPLTSNQKKQNSNITFIKKDNEN